VNEDVALTELGHKSRESTKAQNWPSCPNLHSACRGLAPEPQDRAERRSDYDERRSDYESWREAWDATATLRQNWPLSRRSSEDALTSRARITST